VLRPFLLLALVTSTATASPLGGQERASAPGIEPHPRVRLWSPALFPRPAVGAVVEVRSDTLVFQTARERLQVPASAVARLDHSLGRSRLRGATYGAAIGAPAGIGAAALLFGSSGDWGYVTDGAAAWLGIGGVIGGSLGAVLARERWRRVVP
jgi:hypothetical protein